MKSSAIFRRLLFVKARERLCEQEALKTTSHLQQDISELRLKVKNLQDELSSAQNQQSQQSKVSLLVDCSHC